MRRFNKVLCLLSIAVMVGVSTVGCSSDKNSTTEKAAQKASESTPTKMGRIEEIKKNGKLVLATGNYRPFEYHDEKTNKMVGYDIDVAEAIAKKIGVPLEVRDMTFTSLIPTLQNGQADLIIAAMYDTEARRKVVDFCDPYMDTGIVLVVRSNETKIKSIEDLGGKVVGVKTGASSEKVALEMIEKGQKFTTKGYKENVEYLMDLEAGRLDAAFNDLLNQLEYNKTHPNVKISGDPFTKDKLGIAVKKGDKELQEVINTVLKELKESGEAEKMYSKWISDKK